MDTIDRRIVEALTVNARMPLKALSAAVGLSSPSTSDRLRRLEERGIIRRYTVELDARALGFTLQAIVRIRPLPGRSASVEALLMIIPEICECDKVTGDDCFIARLFVTSIDRLDDVLAPIAEQAETSTAIVKSQPIRRRLPPVR